MKTTYVPGDIIYIEINGTKFQFKIEGSSDPECECVRIFLTNLTNRMESYLIINKPEQKVYLYIDKYVYWLQQDWLDDLEYFWFVGENNKNEEI